MSDSTIITSNLSARRYLLEPVVAPPRPDLISIYTHPYNIPLAIMNNLRQSRIVAMDFETNGNDCSHPDFKSVGVGFATDKVAFYVDLSTTTALEKRDFLLSIGHLPLIGHNVYFDGGVYFRETQGWHANWKYCTYGLFKQLSSESNELKWSLKDAQKELLSWPETNEVELDQWLIDNGYFNKQNKRPSKAEMWRAPRVILGKYCALDAQSTYLLFTKVLEPAMLRYSPVVLSAYHQKDFLTEIEFLIEQQIHGITIDKERLLTYEKELSQRIENYRTAFLNHPEVCNFITQYNEGIVSDIFATQPARFRTKPAAGAEPPKLTKAGTISKSYLQWEAKQERLANWEQDPENESKVWQNWKARFEEAKVTQHYNLQSGLQLRWLFYDKLKHTPSVFTESGLPAVDENALKLMGAPGKALIDYVAANKEYSYVTACIERLRQDDKGLFRIHPQFRIPGTLTGRLAGSSGLNVQQLPKSGGYLACWRPMEPGQVWVDFDIVGAEAVIATELTRDPAMMAIYGPQVKRNDIYLYFGSNIPGIGEQIRATGYDPENPSPEALARAKKECKALRQVCKTVVLAKQYGAGAAKIHHTLKLDGINITYDEVKAISDGYDQTFSVLKSFGRKLEQIWQRNKGYVLNGIGRPITVSEDYIRDLPNRVIQSTGHDIHVKCIRIFRDVMKIHRIGFTWVICDFHDQAIISCKQEDAQRIKDLISTEVIDKLNIELQGLIPIKYDPQIVRSMAEAKVEGYSEHG